MSTPPVEPSGPVTGVDTADAHGATSTALTEVTAPPVVRTRASFLRAHRAGLLAAAAVFVILALLATRWWMGPQVSTLPVLRRDFVQSVVASGHVQTPHRLELGAQITAKVQRVPVAAGQAVRAGDLLVVLDAAEVSAASRQADAAVVQAQARLRQLREVQAPVAQQTLRQAQASLENARAAWTRGQSLFEQGFIGQAALDDARKAVDLADAQVRSASSQLDTTGPSGSDQALALANVRGAQASAEAARARLGYTRIHAPVAGILIARDVEEGDVVQPGKPLLTLSPVGATQVVVQIDEKNLALLAPGQAAWVSADAYAQQRFEAVLVFINPGVNTTTGAVEVKLDVPAPPEVLRQDMTVSVDIEVARRRQALVAPVAAVHDADGLAPWVLRVEGRHAVRRPVRLGLRSAGLAEVVEGLAEGDVLVTAPLTLAPGARIRTSAAEAPDPASK